MTVRDVATVSSEQRCLAAVSHLRDAPDMNVALRAAIEVAGHFGIVATGPVLLQETNNTVVWLQPEPVVAKVAVREHSKNEIRLEHAVAVELAALKAESVRPIPGSHPLVHSGTGFVVTLWERLEGPDRSPVRDGELAASLERLHTALGRTEVKLPSFRGMLTKARQALEDDSFMAPTSDANRALLRVSYDEGFVALDRFRPAECRLHGEPHEGNRISTRQGLRWIDFESCCIGPLEWDLAFQHDQVVGLFPQVDLNLLAVLRTLNSARVATWCLASRHPEMQKHGDVHLNLLQQPFEDRTRLPGIPSVKPC